MMSFVKVFAYFLIVALAGTFLHIFCVSKLYKLLFADSNIVSASSSYKIVFYFLWSGGISLSILVFPVFAYLVRNQFFQNPKLFFVRRLTLGFFFVFPLIIAAGLALIQINEAARDREFSRQRDLEDAQRYEYRRNLFDSANVSVTAVNARVTERRKFQSVLEFTLQIKNVPPEIKSYKISFTPYILMAKTGETSVLSNNMPDNETLEAIFENGKWIFRKFFSKEPVSENAEKVPFRLEFNPGEIADNYPKSISPEFNTPAKYESTNSNYTFYSKEIALEILTQ